MIYLRIKEGREMTACKECKHCKPVGDDYPSWHSVKCLAVKSPDVFDCFEGILVKGTYANCFEVNNEGNCPHFEPREE